MVAPGVSFLYNDLEKEVWEMDLFSSVTELRGIGPTRAKQLQRLHIETLYDLIAFFPRAYEDRTKISSIAGLEPGIPPALKRW